MTDVLYVPDLQNSLLSVLHLVSKHRFRVVIEGTAMSFYQQDSICFTASIRSNTAYLNVSTPPVAESALAARTPLTRSLWHRRLCHIGSDKIELVIKNSLAAGLKLDSNDPFASICVPCVHGKHHRAPFPHQASNRSQIPFERIHSDLHEVPTLTSSGFRYWLTFIDDASRCCWVYALQRKSDTFDAFTQFKAYVETQYNGVICFFRQDKGGEFIGNVWDEFFAEHGIRRENTVTATPQQNGVAERKNRILAELITALLNEAKLPKSFWGKALCTVNRVLNMLPSSALPPNTTPFEIIEKRKPDYSILRVFGCRAYALVDRKARKSLDSHVVPCIFLGYPEDFRGWRLWDPRAKRIIISRDVIWDENSMPGNSSVPVAPILLSELSVTPDQEEAPRRPSVHFRDESNDTSDDLAIPFDDANPAAVLNAPPAVPVVPASQPRPLTPPMQSPAPSTPAPSVKREEESPHPYFGLRSPTPARRTPAASPFTTAGNSPFVTPESSPSVSPEPVRAPSPEPAPRRSTRSTRGHAPGPNIWNATDRLRGLAHTVPVQSYAESSRRRTPVERPSASPLPVPLPGAYREPTPSIPSDEEEEEASAHPTPPQNTTGVTDEDGSPIPEVVPVRGRVASASLDRHFVGTSLLPWTVRFQRAIVDLIWTRFD